MDVKYEILNFEWGKRGLSSLVARLAQAADRSMKIQRDTPYAELCMNPSDTLSHFELPFLLKILSVYNAMPIEAHPTKNVAEELHRRFPRIYQDANHRSGVAIALTPFEVLCGFRAVEEVKSFVTHMPELHFLVAKGMKVNDDMLFLKYAFQSVLNCDKAQLMRVINSLLERFETANAMYREMVLASLVKRLHFQFPYSNGILMVYFMNYIKLKPLEAVYLAGNEPHAYLSGDCLETTASSKNVLSVGLTSKFIDVETLCDMLTFAPGAPENKILHPKQEQTHTRLFEPPDQDFAVAEITLSTNIPSYTMVKRESLSVLIVVSGKASFSGRPLSPGKCYLVPADTSLEICEIEEDTFCMFQIFTTSIK